jgi:surface polysaccharide O-acyltransferase-like enzyme
VLTRPGASAARSLWFVYVLFEYYLVFPLLMAAVRGSCRALIAVAAILHLATHVFDVPQFGAADQFCEYSLFFALGMAFAQRRDWLAPLFTQHALLFWFAFLLSFLTVEILPEPTSKTIVGLCSLPAFYAAAAALDSTRDAALLHLLSKYTFTIYLMNTLFIGLVKGICVRWVQWDGDTFVLFYFPVLLAVGIAGPILAHRFVLSRFPYLARVTI